ncbi:S24 family peptidase [Neisseria bergeri]|uniref:S24 family peptidase n=1 Tax=Neisseria bergeri TaxID=1906581 RepID=UPI00272A9FB1|nr:S24 family peptidase [Neisseria bergeri]
MKSIEEIRRERLNMLVLEYGSQAELARKIDKSPTQIWQWINGTPSVTGTPRSLRNTTAREIEKRVNKPTGWLDRPLGEIKEEEPVVRDSITFRHKEILVSCGEGVVNADFPEVIRTLEIPTNQVIKLFGRHDVEHLDIVGISGDSMEPTLPQKGLAFVDTRINYFDGDGIYAFYYRDGCYMKRLQKLPGKMIAKSDNPLYDPFEINPEHEGEFIIISKFVAVLPLEIISL